MMYISIDRYIYIFIYLYTYIYAQKYIYIYMYILHALVAVQCTAVQPAARSSLWCFAAGENG